MSDPTDDPAQPPSPERDDRRTLVDALDRKRKLDLADDWERGWDDAIVSAIELVEDHFDRINVALQVRFDDGRKKTGLDPYGYRTDPASGRLVAHEGEQKLIALIKKLRGTHDALGNPMSYRKIAATLWAHEYKARHGRKLDHKQVIRILAAEPRKLLPPDSDKK